MADAVDNKLFLRELPRGMEVTWIIEPLFLGQVCVGFMLKEKVEGSHPAEVFAATP